MRKALTIAGSDPSGGAGIQADLKVFSAFKVYGMSVITAITSQNTCGVQEIYALSARLVGSQLDSLLSDISTHAVKTGMLANGKIIAEVAEKLRTFKLSNIVVDPVMRATTGRRLLDSRAVDVMKVELFPLATVLTPNLEECELLTGQRIRSVADMKRAAERLYAVGCTYVVVKGGHLDGEPRDILFDGKEHCEFRSERIGAGDVHGTGCAFSAALAAALAKDCSVRDAVKSAKDYLVAALAGSHEIGGGIAVLNHHVEV